MNATSQPDDVAELNQDALEELAWAIEGSAGKFLLILARCNSANLRSRLVRQLQALCSVEIREIVLEPSVQTLYATVKTELVQESPQALMVCGLELVSNLDRVLIAANQVREEFRKNFPFPFVLWVTDEVLLKLIRLAPDFQSWATTVEFAIATEELVNFIQQAANEAFIELLEAGANRFQDNSALDGASYSSRYSELNLTRQELQNRGIKLDPSLEGSLEFILGRDSENFPEESRQHYERSLVLWQQVVAAGREQPPQDGQTNLTPSPRECLSCVLYELGVWWRKYAVRHRAEYRQACDRAKDYFQQCIEVLEQANRPDLVAKFINALGEVLHKLQSWDLEALHQSDAISNSPNLLQHQLEQFAQKAIALHQTYFDPFRLARAYGFLAEVSLAKSAWTEALNYARQALSLIEQEKSTPFTPILWDWQQAFHDGWYWFSLAKAQRAIGQTQCALQTLETARKKTNPQHDPELYIYILGALRKCYFELGDYLTAFACKQKQRLIEYQFRFRAFLGFFGARQLWSNQQIASPDYEEQRSILFKEIAASGRRQDIDRLVERIARADCKLTIIHGPSGVGKSSNLVAGLIPVLKQNSIGTRDVFPIFQRFYTDWVGELAKSLTEVDHLDSIEAILAQLRKNAERDRITVLIFDQLEEFFFTCKQLPQRIAFYEFLRECLNIPYVKVILSIREDYLYLLLECDRLEILDIVNYNILDKNILYYLGYFSLEDAKLVVQTLTQQAQFPLESELIDELVSDLAGELGQVRPIELQVVGAQLQTDNISTLAQYHQIGKKEKLVGQSIEEVIRDCGSENEQIAKLALYLLTNEDNTRPLKTRSELESELVQLADNLAIETERLDLVLKIFVESGLVFQVPVRGLQLPGVEHQQSGNSLDRYQLFHDYLVSPIRRQYEPTLSQLKVELEQERKQRQEIEEQHRRIAAELKQAERNRQQLEARIQQVRQELADAEAEQEQVEQRVREAQEKLSQAEAAREEAVVATELELAGIRALRQFEFSQIDALLATMQAGKRLRELVRDSHCFEDYPAFSPLLALQQILDNIREKNRLQGHQDEVKSVSFSPDGQYLATASNDNTAQLWDLQGNQLATLAGHRGNLNSVSFSPDGRHLATASNDNTAQLWDLQGNLLVKLEGHRGYVNSVSFSPDGQYLATASSDNTARLWDLQGNLLVKLEGHRGYVNSVSFSPDGEHLVTASSDCTARLWDLQGKPVAEFPENDWIRSVSFSPDGQHLATASNDNIARLWDLRGNPLAKLEGHRGNLNSVSFSPDEQYLATASKDGTARLWNLQGKQVAEFQGHEGWVWSVSFSPNGHYLATASGDCTLRLWNLQDKPFVKFRHQEDVNSVSFSPDGRHLATGSGDGTAKLWNLQGKQLVEFKGHRHRVRGIGFSPDGQYLATTSFDSTARLWDLQGHQLVEFKGHQNRVNSVSFSPNGQYLVTASFDDTARLWDLQGNQLVVFTGHQGLLWSVSFSPNGQLLATASEDCTVKLWDLQGKSLATLKVHQRRVSSVSFSPDGQLLATASSDGTARLWDLQGNQVAEFKGHQGWVSCITFNPAQPCLATASGDGTARLWDWRGNQLAEYKGHQRRVSGVSFSPDGQYLATASDDGTARLWRIENLDQLLERGCDWLRDYLTTNSNVSDRDRDLCDGIDTQKE